MNNLPLQPLKWDGDMLDTPLHTYQYLKDHDSKGKYMVKYAGKNRSLNEPARGFATIDEAKAWAWNHYNEKMQPYVKTSPIWIDVNDQVPDKSGRYMVVHQTIKPVKNKSTPVDIDTYDENEKAWTFFRSGIMQEVTHWMPIPEFKESDR